MMSFRIMMAGLITLLGVTTMSASSQSDEVRADAQYIVEQLVTEDVFVGAMESIGELLASSLIGEFSQNGSQLSSRGSEVLAQMLGMRLAIGMTDAMQEKSVDIYLLNLSPETLAAYRAFLESNAGQEVVAFQPILLREGAAAGEDIAALIVGDIMRDLVADIRNDRFPDGTLNTTKAELRALMLD